MQILGTSTLARGTGARALAPVNSIPFRTAATGELLQPILSSGEYRIEAIGGGMGSDETDGSLLVGGLILIALLGGVMILSGRD